MARKTADAVFDAALQHVIDNADQIVFCEGEPADHAAATSDKGSGGVALGETSVAAGDFSILDGDTSGRKLRFGGVSGVATDASGSRDHVAFVDNGNNDLLHATPMSSAKTVAAGSDTMAVDPFDVLEIRDPQAP